MPRLLLFTACEKVIIDSRSNVISLVSLLQDIRVQVPPSGRPSQSAIIPIQWNVVSIFEGEVGDAGKTFEHRATLFDPAEMEIRQTPVAAFQLREQHRVINPMNGMPVGTEGRLMVKAYLREKDASEWRELGSYPINVKWQSAPPVVH